MKRSQLRQIIREEIRRILGEADYSVGQKVTIKRPSKDHQQYGVKKGARGKIVKKEKWPSPTEPGGQEWVYHIRLSNGYEDVFDWTELESY